MAIEDSCFNAIVYSLVNYYICMYHVARNIGESAKYCIGGKNFSESPTSEIKWKLGRLIMQCGGTGVRL